MLPRRLKAGLVILLGVFPRPAGAAEAYDPLATARGERPAAIELVARYADADRSVPVRVDLPPADAAAPPWPTVVFSHGLGGARHGNRYLAEQWTGRGYACVFVQHAGSDDAIWRGVPPEERMAAFAAAANPENLRHRVRDVPVVLDALTRWNAEEGHALAGRLDLERLALAGHSFGAITAQFLGGAVAFPIGESVADPRVRAVLAMSPSAPMVGDAAEAFGGVRVPWLLMTGTHDHAWGGRPAELRRAVFAGLPTRAGAAAGGDTDAVPHFELVLDGAEHSAFNDGGLPSDRMPRKPGHHVAVRAVSTAFWDATLRGDAAALAWLRGDAPRAGVRGVLDAADRWRTK